MRGFCSGVERSNMLGFHSGMERLTNTDAGCLGFERLTMLGFRSGVERLIKFGSGFLSGVSMDRSINDVDSG